MKKFLAILFLSSLISFSYGKEDIKINWTSTKALEKAIRKNMWDVITNDDAELLNEELEHQITYPFLPDERTKFIVNLTKKIADENGSELPLIYITNRKTVKAAAMTPNKYLLISEDALKSLSENELSFIIAHEMSHLVHNDSYFRIYFASEKIVEKGIMVDAEKMVYALFMIPGMADFHKEREKQADLFAFKYMKKYQIKFDCEKMFKKLLDGEEEFKDFHNSYSKRCKMNK